MRNTDWMPFHVGDRVYFQDDPRHVGRVEAINSNVKVRWEDHGVISYIPINDAIFVEGGLIKVEKSDDL